MIFIISVIITIMSFVGCFCVKKPAIRTLFVIVGVFCGLMDTLIGSFTYATKYRINPVDSSVSPDGKYELMFQQIGEAGWPFGSTHARLVLKDESGTITKYPFYVLNDGCSVHPDSWQVTWRDTYVEVVISGEEQNDDQYILYFDGKEDYKQLDTKQGASEESFQEPDQESEPDSLYMNYYDFFEKPNGCAIIYDVYENDYYIYNTSTFNDRRSPLSTFKIVATLIGLRNGVIQDENSTMEYNGTDYGVEAWNRNLNLKEAMESSCVWYFRQLIDTVGEEEVHNELWELGYGNSDTSKWNGSGINTLADLNGFWLDSSLEITPMEQVQVLTKIFQGRSIYSDEEINVLKNVMPKESVGEYTIYGKTGTNQKKEGWYVGIAESNEKEYCFALYVNSDDPEYEASGRVARELVKEIFEKDIWLKSDKKSVEK